MKTLLATSLAFFALAPGLPAQTNTNLSPTLPPMPDLKLVTPKPIDAKLPIVLAQSTPAILGNSLLDACTQNDLNHATELLNEGVSVDFDGKYGNTPLILAAMRSPDMVKLILAHHPNLELRENHGYTALGVACWTGKTDCAIELMDAGANIETINNNGHTPLILAIEYDDAALVKALIDHHVDVNKATEDGSALWWAVGKNRLEATAMLLGAGADFQPHVTVPPDPRRPWYTVVARAAMSNNPALIDLLLSHGANINETDTAGRTALTLALEFAREPTILHLLDKGAEVKIADKEGRTPLMYAVVFNQQQSILQALLQHGAVVDAKDNHGRTALVCACMDNTPATIPFLLDHGADINVADAKGNVPLLYANNRGETDLVKLLVKRGAKPVDLHIIAKDMPDPALPMPHRWALAVSALYSQLNGKNPNVLGGGESATRAKRFLSNVWKIYDQRSLEQKVDYLYDPGYHSALQTKGATFAQTPNWLFWVMTFSDTKPHNEIKAVRQNYLIWKSRSGLAIDLCRAADLVNLGYACHYIDEDEAWRRLLFIAHQAQTSFKSWHEMCDNLLDSREMITGKVDPRLDACGDLLCNAKDPNSPWNQIPWSTDLSAP